MKLPACATSMMPVLRCLATSFGSAGDFLPTLAIAAALRRRGHGVTFVANPLYASRVAQAGVDFVPAGERLDVFAAIEGNPAYTDPANAGMLLRDFVTPDTDAVYRVASERLQSTPVDVVLACDVGFGALWAAAERRVPSVVVTASPVLWMGWASPVVLGDGAVRGALAAPLTVAASALMRWFMRRHLRALSRRVGTPLANLPFRAPEEVAALRLGLWSPALRAPVASDPANGRICGYTRASGLGGPAPGMPAEVAAFLDDGPPPIVAGLGSVCGLAAGPLLVACAEAAADVGRRCLILGPPAGTTFPAGTLAAPWAPYDRVFPRAAAVVFHGGSGTTGEALRAGRPLVGTPIAYDQFTLCEWTRRLGVGVRVPQARRSRRDLARVLERVLSDADMQRRADTLGARFAAEPDGAEVAADEIERLVVARTAA